MLIAIVFKLPSIWLISENPDLKREKKRTDFNTSSAIAT